MPEPQKPSNDVAHPRASEEQAAMAAGKLGRPSAAAARKKPSCAAGKTSTAAKWKGRMKTKPSKITEAKRGWKVEERIRENGGVDRYYISPHGKPYRLRSEAIAAGFSG